MLRLVGGTEVKVAGRKRVAKEIDAAVESAAGASTYAQDTLARRLVMESMVGDLTVRELIADANEGASGQKEGLTESMDAFRGAMITLNRIGVAICSGGYDLGLDTMVYGTILEPSKVVRHVPQLKKLSVSLAGLALY